MGTWLNHRTFLFIIHGQIHLFGLWTMLPKYQIINKHGHVIEGSNFNHSVQYGNSDQQITITQVSQVVKFQFQFPFAKNLR